MPSTTPYFGCALIAFPSLDCHRTEVDGCTGGFAAGVSRSCRRGRASMWAGSTMTAPAHTPAAELASKLEATLREVCDRLAPLDRTPCSPGEREAAVWIGRRLEIGRAS